MTVSVLRPLTAADLDDVVGLNDRFVHLTAPMSHERVLEMAETGAVEVVAREGAGITLNSMLHA